MYENIYYGKYLIQLSVIESSLLMSGLRNPCSLRMVNWFPII